MAARKLLHYNLPLQLDWSDAENQIFFTHWPTYDRAKPPMQWIAKVSAALQTIGSPKLFRDIAAKIHETRLLQAGNVAEGNGNHHQQQFHVQPPPKLHENLSGESKPVLQSVYNVAAKDMADDDTKT